MILKGIELREISQREEGKRMISLICDKKRNKRKKQ